MAEVFKANGYVTGIFGKWHLGDNYPCRPVDQGFDEAIVHGAGGIGQVGDLSNAGLISQENESFRFLSKCGKTRLLCILLCNFIYIYLHIYNFN